MNRVILAPEQAQHTISRHLYGHFSEHLGRCIYEGYWVGEQSDIPHTRGIRNDVVEELRAIGPSVMRWPGGCFADEYHWMDGVGPREQRPEIVNVHWGGVTENNHFGTHEFFDLCEQLGADPYVCGNVGSGTVREMRDWVEYCTFDGRSPMADWRRRNGREQPWRLPFFGVGNENWGCGGWMKAEHYANLYRQYACYVRTFGGNQIQRIACGPNADDYHWTEVMMNQAAFHDCGLRLMDGLALHYYTVPGANRSATQFGVDDWWQIIANALRMKELIERHSTIMDRRDPEAGISLVVDEWGTWYDVEPGTNPGFLYQQNTMRDAVVAGLTLNIFNNHCRRVRMANIAQTVNVLQAMVLTDGARMTVTPTYHVFAMFRAHQDAVLLPATVITGSERWQGHSIPLVSASASRQSDGTVCVSLVNPHPTDSAEVDVVCAGHNWKSVTSTLLTGPMTAHNTFDQPNTVAPVPGDARLTTDGVRVQLPSGSVCVLKLQ